MKTGLILKLCAVAALSVLVLSVVRGAGYLFLVALAVLIHELGHIAAARLLHVPLVKGKGSLIGFSLKFDFSASSYFKEFTVCAAGAVFNLAACLLAFLIFKDRGPYFVFFIFSDLSLALFNLLPISPLDGSGMLRSLLCLVTKNSTAERVSNVTSALFSLAFFTFCVYVQMKIGVNFSLMFISVYLLYNAAKNVGVIQKAP